MDEFDVFMDEVARKVSMNSLLEFARGDEELSRQFILISRKIFPASTLKRRTSTSSNRSA